MCCILAGIFCLKDARGCKKCLVQENCRKLYGSRAVSAIASINACHRVAAYTRIITTHLVYSFVTPLIPVPHRSYRYSYIQLHRAFARHFSPVPSASESKK